MLLYLPLVASLFDLLQEAKTYLRSGLWGFRNLPRDIGQSLRSTLKASGRYEVSIVGIMSCGNAIEGKVKFRGARAFGGRSNLAKCKMDAPDRGTSLTPRHHQHTSNARLPSNNKSFTYRYLSPLCSRGITIFSSCSSGQPRGRLSL